MFKTRGAGRSLTAGFFAGLALLGTAALAEARTFVAGTCAVDEASTSKFKVTWGDLMHKGSHSGVVAARCNYQAEYSNPSYHGLEVTYRDPDGPGDASWVIVQLIRVKPDGSAGVAATFNSNDYAASTSGSQTDWVTFSHDINFDAYEYYVQFRVFRSSSAASLGEAPSATSARLFSMID